MFPFIQFSLNFFMKMAPFILIFIFHFDLALFAFCFS